MIDEIFIKSISTSNFLFSISEYLKIEYSIFEIVFTISDFDILSACLLNNSKLDLLEIKFSELDDLTIKRFLK